MKNQTKQLDIVKITLEQFSRMRNDKGWTIRYAASQLGVSYSHLSDVLNRRKPPSQDVLVKIFSLLSSEQIANKYSNVIQ